MSNTAIAYQFDGQGYYLSETLVQKMGDDYLIPSDTTMTKPTFKDGYWTKWNGKKWILDKIPSTCAEVIERKMTCISNGPGKHNQEVKAVMESLVESDKEHYKTVVSDDFVMTIEEIPEPTEEEKELEREQERQRALQVQIDELSKEMNKADLNGDEEWKADLRAEYARLIEEL